LLLGFILWIGHLVFSRRLWFPETVQDESRRQPPKDRRRFPSLADRASAAAQISTKTRPAYIRRLEREYGAEAVQAYYRALTFTREPEWLERAGGLGSRRGPRLRAASAI